MSRNPAEEPTVPQIDYARRLGIEFDEETITFGELSRRIDAIKPSRRPSEKQIEVARSLGIELDEELITGPELHTLLDQEIARQSRAALRANPVLKVGETIMYKSHPYEITAIDQRRWRVQLKPCHKGYGRSVAPWIITLKDAVHVDVM